MSLLTLDQCNGLLANGILATSGFQRFLREREKHCLETYERDFLKAVLHDGLPCDPAMKKDVKGNDVFVANFKFRRKPSLWLSLLSETSDVKLGLKHLMTACALTDCWGEDWWKRAGVKSDAEWTEFLVYAQPEIIYRVLERIQNGLVRSVRAAIRDNKPKAQEVIRALLSDFKDKREKFDRLRGGMMHRINFAQQHILEGRAWDWFIVQDNPADPSESLQRVWARYAQSTRAGLRTEAGRLAQSLIALYPEWEMSLRAMP